MNRLIDDAHAFYRAAIRSVQADRLFQHVDLDALLEQPLDAYRRVFVAGAGKASMAMAGAAEVLLGDRIEQGLVVVPHGFRATLPASQRAPLVVEVVEAGHPVPDQAGVDAATRALRLAASCGEDDLLLVLLSGGGSALWPLPAERLSLEAIQATVRLLLRSGADIHQMNTLRKHLSRIKGGRLASAAFPATTLALVVSDVVDDDLSVIASGPTAPDGSTYGEAVEVLRAYDLWERIPSPVRDHLRRGQRGLAPETPKPGSKLFTRTQTVLLGNNQEALEAARAAAERQGYAARVVARDLVGEARDVGRVVVRQALRIREERPACLLWGGETTVTVTGSGRGGRNQEVALAAALELDGLDRRVVVLSAGTDGVDGPTDAAGAWSTAQTVSEARARGLDPAAFLANNDAYAFFAQHGGLLKPGPTHTNVMDVLMVLVAPR